MLTVNTCFKLGIRAPPPDVEVEVETVWESNQEMDVGQYRFPMLSLSLPQSLHLSPGLFPQCCLSHAPGVAPSTILNLIPRCVPHLHMLFEVLVPHGPWPTAAKLSLIRQSHVPCATSRAAVKQTKVYHILRTRVDDLLVAHTPFLHKVASMNRVSTGPPIMG